jgi:hypothetical protein
MIKNWKTVLASALLSVSTFAAGAVYTSGAHAQNTPATSASPTWERGEYSSNYNIRQVRQRLEGMIDQLQHDQRDYNGHRIFAIQYLQKARTQLDQAIQWDNAHHNQ